jgi:glutathione synthase/RimK-type ligase-like ATP-grasp enzyme
MSLKILPYNIGSESAKALAQALGVKRIKPHGNYRPQSFVTVLNWGFSGEFSHPKMLNKPSAVARASNKLTTLRVLKDAGIPVPDFTTDKAAARAWQQDGFRVLCRTLLNSHSGKGIVIAQPEDSLVSAPLYTKYTNKDYEYRIHVFNGHVIDICEKRKRNGEETTNNLIRTLSNGWVFCREGVNLSEAAKSRSIKAVQALGLDFGAVDLIARGSHHWVLEVNSAPGLQGTTLEKYTEALRSYNIRREPVYRAPIRREHIPRRTVTPRRRRAVNWW